MTRIGLVVVALIALGAIFVLLYQHCKPFRDLVNFLWKEIQTLWEWIEPKLLPAVRVLWELFKFTPLGLVVTHFKELWKIVTDVVGALGKMVSMVTGPFKGALGTLGNGLAGAGKMLHSIDPTARHSPSLVDNVATGVDAIIGHYKRVGTVRLGVSADVQAGGYAGPRRAADRVLANAGGGGTGGMGGVQVRDIIVHDPAPEPAGTTVTRGLRHLALLGRQPQVAAAVG